MSIYLYLKMSKLIDGKTVFDPCVDYYFVDYFHIENCRWIRKPMLTMDEVLNTVNNLPYAFDDVTDSWVPVFKKLRITPHSQLSQPHQSFNKETNLLEDDEFTNIAYEFGDLYDCISEVLPGTFFDQDG